jgi:hypothetical protein
MLIDAPQSTHAQMSPKLMEHARRRIHPPQPGKTSPAGLFGQLGDQKIEGMRGCQQRQQMHPPQLGRTQIVPPTSREIARKQRSDEVIRHIAGELFEQCGGADGRQRSCHPRTLPQVTLGFTPSYIGLATLF